MSFRLVSTVAVLGTGLAFSACTSVTKDPSPDSVPLANASSIERAGSDSVVEKLAVVSQELESGGGGPPDMGMPPVGPGGGGGGPPDMGMPPVGPGGGGGGLPDMGMPPVGGPGGGGEDLPDIGMPPVEGPPDIGMPPVGRPPEVGRPPGGRPPGGRPPGRGRLRRGHWGYGPGGVIVVGTPVFVGVPSEYYGWIRNVDLEIECQSIAWSRPECSFVTDYAACIPNIGCFVRPY